MHIIMFSDQHPATLGGQQVSLGLQRYYLEQVGHTVTVCSPTAQRLSSSSFRRADDVLLPSLPAGGYSFTVACAAADRLIDRALRDRPEIDVVHVQADFWGAWTGYRFARRHRLPVVHTMHTNIETGLPAVMPFPRAVLRFACLAHRYHLRCGPVRGVPEYVRAFAKLADTLIVPSSHFADRLEDYGVTCRPVVIPTGVDDRAVEALLAEPVATHTRPMIVWSGRISREKRLEDMLEAFARARVDADLAVYGDGTELPRCRALADRLGIADRVRFSGAVSHDVALSAMRHADVVAQTSLAYETQGLTAYEAVALGARALVRDPNVARDLPSDRITTVGAPDVTSLAQAIRSAVAARRPDGTPPVGLTQSHLTPRIEEVYRKVCATHGGGNPNH